MTTTTTENSVPAVQQTPDLNSVLLMMQQQMQQMQEQMKLDREAAARAVAAAEAKAAEAEAQAKAIAASKSRAKTDEPEIDKRTGFLMRRGGESGNARVFAGTQVHIRPMEFPKIEVVNPATGLKEFVDDKTQRPYPPMMIIGVDGMSLNGALRITCNHAKAIAGVVSSGVDGKTFADIMLELSVAKSLYDDYIRTGSKVGAIGRKVGKRK
jgi:hypothetical protein